MYRHSKHLSFASGINERDDEEEHRRLKESAFALTLSGRELLEQQRQELQKKRELEGRAERNPYNLHYEDAYLRRIYRAYVECCRNLRYCHSLIKNTDYKATEGLGEPQYFEDGIVEMVSRWKADYNLHSDYPTHPSPQTVEARVLITRPPTPMSAALKSTKSQDSDKRGSTGDKTRKAIVISGNSVEEQKKGLDAIREKSKKDHIGWSDEELNDFLPPRRAKHHFSDSDSESEEEEMEEDGNEVYEEHGSSSPSNKSHAGQGLEIPRQRSGQDLIKRDLEKEAAIAIEAAREVDERTEKFRLRFVRNFIDSSDSDSSEDQEEES